jgi:ribose-phosphate pyrophosphokinase
MGFSEVRTLDPHNRTVCRSCGIRDIDPLPFIERSLVKFARSLQTDHVVVLFPDQGASERYSLPSSIGNNTDQIFLSVLKCAKKRDPSNGNLLGFTVPKSKEFSGKSVMLVDDICDGGGTFVGISDALAGLEMDLGLYITHGIFSKGFDSLLPRFHRIYTTDTISPTAVPDQVHVFDSGPVIWESHA